MYECTGILSARIYMHYGHDWLLWRQEKGTEFPKSEYADCKLHVGASELTWILWKNTAPS